MHLAQNDDINILAKMRVYQQQDDWKDKFTDNDHLEYRTKEYLIKHLNKDLFILIYKENNKIIATCGLQVIDYLPQCNDNGKVGNVCNVYTIREQRNRGIQTRLITECIQLAKEKNINELQLSSDNDNAISIYKKQGFVFDNLIMKLDVQNNKQN